MFICTVSLCSSETVDSTSRVVYKDAPCIADLTKWWTLCSPALCTFQIFANLKDPGLSMPGIFLGSLVNAFWPVSDV